MKLEPRMGYRCPVGGSVGAQISLHSRGVQWLWVQAELDLPG